MFWDVFLFECFRPAAGLIRGCGTRATGLTVRPVTPDSGGRGAPVVVTWAEQTEGFKRASSLAPLSTSAQDGQAVSLKVVPSATWWTERGPQAASKGKACCSSH